MNPDGSYAVAGPVLERSFRGHKGAVTSVVFTSDTKQLVSGSRDGCVFVYNFKPSLRSFRLSGHKGAVYTVDTCDTLKKIASGSRDKTVRIYHNSVEGRCTVLKGHSAPVRSVHFSSDGQLLMTGSDDKTIKVWSVLSQKFQFTLTGHSNWVRTCRFSPDGLLAVSAGDDKAVRVWDIATRRCLRMYEQHLGQINTVRFHPSGSCVASGGVDNAINLWDLRANRLVQRYVSHHAGVTSISFHPSGNYLLSSSLDSSLKVWDLREGRLMYTLHGHQGAALSASFSASGEYFASAAADKQVLVWRSGLGPPIDPLQPTLSNSQGLFSDAGAAWQDDNRAYTRSPIPQDSITSQHGDPTQPVTVVHRQPSTHAHLPTSSALHNPDAADVPSVAGRQTRCRLSSEGSAHPSCNFSNDGSGLMKGPQCVANTGQRIQTSNCLSGQGGLSATTHACREAADAAARGPEQQEAHPQGSHSEQGGACASDLPGSHPESQAMLATDTGIVTLLMRQMEAMTRGMSALDTRLAGLECQLEKSKGPPVTSGLEALQI